MGKNRFILNMNSSPNRGQFRIESEMKRVHEGKQTLEQAQETLVLFKSWENSQHDLEQTDEWRKNNMEYDLRSTKWICDKTKASDSYAQNLYAAICNNDFIKNEVWCILREETWGASWRSAGGIVANMREEGDYINWYCSGIREKLDAEEYAKLDEPSREKYHNYVSESVVTDEIRMDLLKLGWTVKPVEQ